MTELGQLIPLHITSADNMTDFETVLVRLLITLIFQISRFSFCFVNALTVSGQLIPLHIASADNLANLGITQACSEIFLVVQSSPC